MSQTSATTTASHLNYESIFLNALEAYKRRTGNDLRSHPLLAKLEACDSPDAVLATLREQIPGLDKSDSNEDGFTKWLNPTVNVLYSFSSTIGGGIGLVGLSSARLAQNCVLIFITQVYPPAGVIFSGIGILLSVSVLGSLAQVHVTPIV
jgi:hypothetical protein